MKKIALVALATTALASSPAFAADEDSASFELGGTVQEQCHLEAPTDAAFGTFNLMNGADDVPGEEALLINNGSQTAINGTLWMSCNYAAKITVEGDGMSTASGAETNDSDDFTNVIHYRVDITPTDGSFSNFRHQTSARSVTTQDVPGAFHDQAGFKVYVDGDDNGKRPIAGVYSDTATVTIGPV